jgi:hypothetical protein
MNTNHTLKSIPQPGLNVVADLERWEDLKGHK